MNIGFWSCLALGILFAIITLVFAILGEKAAILISGFNTLTKEERRLRRNIRAQMAIENSRKEELGL